jgi:hypothetical protein
MNRRRIRLSRQLGTEGAILTVDRLTFPVSEEELGQLAADVLRALEARRGEEHSEDHRND